MKKIILLAFLLSTSASAMEGFTKTILKNWSYTIGRAGDHRNITRCNEDRQASAMFAAEKRAYQECKKHYFTCLSDIASRFVLTNGSLDSETLSRYRINPAPLSIYYGCEASATVYGIQ